jgi:hypothetical protein
MTNKKDQILSYLIANGSSDSQAIAESLNLADEEVCYYALEIRKDYPTWLALANAYGRKSKYRISIANKPIIEGFIKTGGYTKIDTEQNEKKQLEARLHHLTELQIEQIKQLPLQDKKARFISVVAAVIAGLALIVQIIQILL